MYAVTIEPLNSIFFLSGLPEGTEGEIQDDVDLDLPCNLLLGSDGAGCSEQVLCRSVTNQKHYKLFKNRRDIVPTEFQPTGKHFGGVYSRASWERFLKILPAESAFRALPDEDELRRRRDAGPRIKALRERILAVHGEMPDSTNLIREDRAR